MKNTALSRKINSAKLNLDYALDDIIEYIEALESDLEKSEELVAKLESDIESKDEQLSELKSELENALKQ